MTTISDTTCGSSTDEIITSEFDVEVPVLFEPEFELSETGEGDMNELHSSLIMAAKKAGKGSKSKKDAEEEEEDEDADEDEKDEWENPEEEEDWDPDFDEFDIPDSKNKKGSSGKSSRDEEDLGLDDDFKDMDLFNDNDFDEEDDDY